VIKNQGLELQTLKAGLAQLRRLSRAKTRF